MRITKKMLRLLAEAQKEEGFSEMQNLINSGEVWKFEGSMGRAAMEALRSGACYLPDNPTFDYYGNRIPARGELKPYTMGTLENSIVFYSFDNQVK